MRNAIDDTELLTQCAEARAVILQIEQACVDAAPDIEERLVLRHWQAKGRHLATLIGRCPDVFTAREILEITELTTTIERVSLRYGFDA